MPLPAATTFNWKPSTGPLFRWRDIPGASVRGIRSIIPGAKKAATGGLPPVVRMGVTQGGVVGGLTGYFAGGSPQSAGVGLLSGAASGHAMDYLQHRGHPGLAALVGIGGSLAVPWYLGRRRAKEVEVPQSGFAKGWHEAF